MSLSSHQHLTAPPSWLAGRPRPGPSHAIGARVWSESLTRLAPSVVIGKLIMAFGFVTVGLVLPQSIGATDARTATPTSATALLRPDCDVSPRPFADVAKLANEPPGTLMLFGLGTPTPPPPSPAVGVPADAGIVAAATETIGKAFACTNAGDLLRLSALFSDDYLRRQLGGLPEEAYALVATPVVLPEVDRTRLLAVADVLMMADGRIAATVRTDKEISQLILVESAGRYLVDDVYPLQSREGTPTP